MWNAIRRRRGAVLAVAGVLVGLTGCGGDAGSPSQVVASVSGDEVTESQVNTVLERQGALKPDQVAAASRRAVAELVDQEIVLQRAREAKLDRDQQIVQRIEASKRDIVARAYLDRIADGAPKPTANDIRAYYDDNRALFAERRIYTFQELVVEATDAQQNQIEAQVATLKSATELDTFLKSLQVKSTSKSSTIAPENVPMAMLQRVGSLKVGQGLVLRVKGGLRVLLLLGTKDAPVAEEQARPAITAFLVARNKRQSVEREMASLRSVSKVSYFGKYADLAASAAPASSAQPAASDARSAVGDPPDASRLADHS